MDPDPGGPKTRGSGGSGSATLLLRDPSQIVMVREQRILKVTVGRKRSTFKLDGDLLHLYLICNEQIIVSEQSYILLLGFPDPSLFYGTKSCLVTPPSAAMKRPDTVPGIPV